jgi:hypothetical protein
MTRANTVTLRGACVVVQINFVLRRNRVFFTQREQSSNVSLEFLVGGDTDGRRTPTGAAAERRGTPMLTNLGAQVAGFSQSSGTNELPKSLAQPRLCLRIRRM